MNLEMSCRPISKVGGVYGVQYLDFKNKGSGQKFLTGHALRSFVDHFETCETVCLSAPLVQCWIISHRLHSEEKKIKLSPPK